MTWSEFVEALGSFPPKTHNLYPPCAPALLAEAESAVGLLPAELLELLMHFNGGELFIDAIPMVTFFGIRAPGYTLPGDLNLVSMTSHWRSAHRDDGSWVIGMTNYEGYFVVDSASRIREWDSADSAWSGEEWSWDSWRQKLVDEGRVYLQE